MTAIPRRSGCASNSGRMVGGGGRTRTYEGLASGFTVISQPLKSLVKSRSCCVISSRATKCNSCTGLSRLFTRRALGRLTSGKISDFPARRIAGFTHFRRCHWCRNHMGKYQPRPLMFLPCSWRWSAAISMLAAATRELLDRAGVAKGGRVIDIATGAGEDGTRGCTAGRACGVCPSDRYLSGDAGVRRRAGPGRRSREYRDTCLRGGRPAARSCAVRFRNLCEFRCNPASDSDLMSAAVPI